MDKYIVLVGNEYGVDVLDNVSLNFVSKVEAYALYEEYVLEYGVSVILGLTETGLVVIEQETKEF